MMIDDLALARAIHILALVHWIGGVTIVTTIILPQARQMPSAKDAVAAFEAFEQRFTHQARISIFLAGLSGIYMLIKLDAWDRFHYASFWWLHLMVAVWAVFALMVYVFEPVVVHSLFHEFALQQKNRAFAMATVFHVVALVVSAIAIGAGILGAHGGL
jgi:uncharacterized membrane protein